MEDRVQGVGEGWGFWDYTVLVSVRAIPVWSSELCHPSQKPICLNRGCLNSSSYTYTVSFLPNRSEAPIEFSIRFYKVFCIFHKGSRPKKDLTENCLFNT